MNIVAFSNNGANYYNITNYENQKYDIDFIGDIESIYSETVILDSPLAKEALSRHIKSGKEDDF